MLTIFSTTYDSWCSGEFGFGRTMTHELFLEYDCSSMDI